MTQVTEAVYENGVLRPDRDLCLREAQRVRVIVEPLDEMGQSDRSAALKRLLEGISSMDFRLRSPLPSRDELHDRIRH